MVRYVSTDDPASGFCSGPERSVDTKHFPADRAHVAKAGNTIDRKFKYMVPRWVSILCFWRPTTLRDSSSAQMSSGNAPDFRHSVISSRVEIAFCATRAALGCSTSRKSRRRKNGTAAIRPTYTSATKLGSIAFQLFSFPRWGHPRWRSVDKPCAGLQRDAGGRRKPKFHLRKSNQRVETRISNGSWLRRGES